MSDPQHDRPPYQPWYEGDFWSLRVRTMHPIARLMFRSLLQHAWDLNPPGYIPNNLPKIKTMADCWHPKIWEAHGETVLSMFEVSGDGAFITNARQLQELAKAYAKRASYSANGKLGAQVKKKRKSKKTNGVDLATLKPSLNLADGLLKQPSHTIPTQPIVKNLLSTSGEVAAKIIRNYTEEEQCTIAEIWPYYLERCQRDPSRYELTPQRVSKCVMRFGESRKKTGTYQGALALMKEAIDNLAASDFHMGRDPKTDGKRYVDFIDHLFASWTVMEKRLNDKQVKRGAPGGPVNNAEADKELERQLGRKP
jgi:hypothetical protein